MGRIHKNNKPNWLNNLEIWLLDTVIALLSQSVLVRSCFRGTYALVNGNSQVFWGIVICFSCLFGLFAGVTCSAIASEVIRIGW